jgi:transcriptional regulator with XRE-family HTH domain
MERTHRRTPLAVAELRAAGLTVRDVAHLLGLTPSRISQIEQQIEQREREVRSA